MTMLSDNDTKDAVFALNKLNNSNKRSS